VSIARIEEVLEDLRQGKMIILVDDEDRENEGDLTMVAEKVTPEAIKPDTGAGSSVFPWRLKSLRD